MLLLTIIGHGLVIDSYLQFSLFHFQRAQGSGDCIVRRLCITPVDAVGVVASANRSLRPGHIEGNGIAGAEGDRPGRCCCSSCPFAADVCCPVTVVQCRAFGLLERRPIICLLIGRRRDGERQLLDLQETVAGIEGDGVVRIRHHTLIANRNAGNDCLLLRTSNGVGPRVLLRDQHAIRSVKGIPDRVAVLLLKQIALSACDADICAARGVIKVLLIRIGETDVEGLSGVVVGSGAAGMGVPLVGRNADVHTGRRNRQRTRNINDAVIGFGICKGLTTLCDLRILRRGRAGPGVCLGAVKLDRSQYVAAKSAGHRDVAQTAAGQRCAAISLRLVVGDDDQLLLVIDVDFQRALIAFDLVGRLRLSFCSSQIGMVIHIAVRRLVLHGEGVTLLHKGGVGVLDLVSIHIEVIHRDLGRRIRHILKGDHIARQRKLQFLCTLRRLIVLVYDVGLCRLRLQIHFIHLNRQFLNGGGGAEDRDRLGFRNLDIVVTCQNIVHGVGELFRNHRVVERDHIVRIIECELDRCRRLVENVSRDGLGILCDRLILLKGRIRDNLVLQNLFRCTRLIVMDGIADGFLRPVRIEGDIIVHWALPVIGAPGLIRLGVPALEGPVVSVRIRRLCCMEAIFLCLRFNCRSPLGVEGDRPCGELEITVEHQTGRHLGRCPFFDNIGALMLRIGIPALPFCTLHGSIRNITGKVTGDVSVQCYLLCADPCSVIIVEGQRILLRIIIEICC